MRPLEFGRLRMFCRGLRVVALVATLHAISAAASGGVANPHQASLGEVTGAQPPLGGIAHVALRVRDLAASVKFYRTLGFEQAFDLSRDGKVYESFIKINDRQFLELYPVAAAPKAGEAEPGFLHLCFEGVDLNAIHDDYVAHGLTPIAVRKAGAGNLLFTLKGPEQPAFPQNIEYTQYQPGSLHWNDRGQHLGAQRMADELVSVTLAMVDPAAAADFYVQKLGFTRGATTRERLLLLPGGSGQSVEMDGSALGAKARLTFRTKGLAGARRRLKKAGLKFGAFPVVRTISVDDPDGNILLFAEAAH